MAKSLGLSMIVKNESANLEACLAGAVDLVNEIIIGDTGSTDNTKIIAAKWGAKVIDIPWVDDFADARNQVLTESTTDWIMTLDADCRITSESKTYIPAVIRSHDFEGAVVLNAKFISSQHAPIYSRFLFPQGYGLKFEGRVHETISSPSGLVLKKFHCPQLEIWHEPCPAEVYRAKQAHYARLLIQELHLSNLKPEAIVRNWKHLGDAYLALEQIGLAHKAFKQSLKYFEEMGANPVDPMFKYLLYQVQKTSESKKCVLKEFFESSHLPD